MSSIVSNENSNVFETTIRVLGGLLTMFELTKNPVFLQKSVQLADSMMPAFETKSGIPVNSINFQRKVAVAAGDGLSSTAEATTLQLEWRHLTGFLFIFLYHFCHIDLFSSYR